MLRRRNAGADPVQLEDLVVTDEKARVRRVGRKDKPLEVAVRVYSFFDQPTCVPTQKP